MKTNHSRQVRQAALAISLLLFCIFSANVLLGSFHYKPWFGDVAEMLMLFCATLFFVVGILFSDKQASPL